MDRPEAEVLSGGVPCGVPGCCSDRGPGTRDGTRDGGYLGVAAGAAASSGAGSTARVGLPSYDTGAGIGPAGKRG